MRSGQVGFKSTTTHGRAVGAIVDGSTRNATRLYRPGPFCTAKAFRAITNEEGRCAPGLLARHAACRVGRRRRAALMADARSFVPHGMAAFFIPCAASTCRASPRHPAPTPPPRHPPCSKVPPMWGRAFWPSRIKRPARRPRGQHAAGVSPAALRGT